MIHLTDAPPPVLESKSWLQQHALPALSTRLGPFWRQPIVLTDAPPVPREPALVVGNTVHVRLPKRWRA